MKKSILLIVSFILLLSPIALAETPQIDLSSPSYSSLVALKIAVEQEIMARPETKEVTVPIGIYEIGVHIPAGEYTLGTTDYASYITFNRSDDFDDYDSRVSSDSIYENETIGRIVLVEGNFVKIEVGSMIFKPFTGLGF